MQGIRRKIFREVAGIVCHTGWPIDKRIEELPYKIIPGEVGSSRSNAFLERAIVGKRLRLAIGPPYRSATEHAPVSDNVEATNKPETYYTPSLINMIKSTCNAYHEKRVFVTGGCQGCLAHPCEEVCPRDATKLDRTNGRSRINDDKCIKYGRCVDVCSYRAIIIQEKPCAAACDVDAISTDENRKADIDHDKCISCGMCLVNYPFETIVDESQIFQVIRAIQSGEKVYAAVTPAFVGQFGPKVTPGKLRAAMKVLGFVDVFEVVVRADLYATQGTIDFIQGVPEKLPFMTTSYCPARSMMAKKLFPEHADYISMALTPIALTTGLIKRHHSNAKVIFISPCAAKKLEAMRTDIRSDVGFVLTFEEMDGISDARHMGVEKAEEDPEGVSGASMDSHNFTVAGGTAKSVVDVIHERYPDKEIKVANAKGLRECRKLLATAKAGKYNGYLLEEMAYPGGYMVGAGTVQPIKKSQASVNLYASKAEHKVSSETEHMKELDKLAD